jgi:hypothetical protein
MLQGMAEPARARLDEALAISRELGLELLAGRVRRLLASLESAREARV